MILIQVNEIDGLCPELISDTPCRTINNPVCPTRNGCLFNIGTIRVVNVFIYSRQYIKRTDAIAI